MNVMYMAFGQSLFGGIFVELVTGSEHGVIPPEHLPRLVFL
jgi:hypothetical protein